MTEYQLFRDYKAISHHAQRDLSLDANHLLERALKEQFENIAASLQHSEVYGSTHPPTISGWRQTGLPDPGGWLDWRIDMRLGISQPYDSAGEQYNVESLVTRRPVGNFGQVWSQIR